MEKQYIIPALMYHSVNMVSSDYLTVPLENFERQIRFLAASYEIKSLGSIVDDIAHERDMGPKTILITFDDGMEDNFLYALPILEKYNCKAVFFIVAKYIGRNNMWNPRAFSVERHMDAGQIRELLKRGYEIGNHSFDHQRLTKFTLEEQKKNIEKSDNILSRLSDGGIHCLSYPYGGVNDTLARYCEERYAVSFATERTGFYDWAKGRSQIRRIFIAPDDSERVLEKKISAYQRGMNYEQ